MFRKIKLYYHTIKYLKIIQLYYQVYYRLQKIIGYPKLNLHKSTKVSSVFLNYSLEKRGFSSYLGNNTFSFLNISHSFEATIDWEYMRYGKLWQYNLSYFDYLTQATITQEEGVRLIKSFIEAYNLKSSIEPYPTSLRIINWIKFISQHRIEDSLIIGAIDAQVKYLKKKIEYHLLGNHLLENAFALLHGGLFLQDLKTINIAEKILNKELEEQILDDGAHFELSPMYHNIIFYRVLEAIDALKNNENNQRPLQKYLEIKASFMRSWLENITFQDGTFPHLNDSTEGITSSSEMLIIMAEALGIKSRSVPLLSSGYRKWKTSIYEMVVDIGKMAPDYQPAHGHSDALQIILHYNQKPILVDTGISTYENNNQRQHERGTSSHNTVTINSDENQSSIWGAFRVAQRANIIINEDNDNCIKASHDGYSSLGIIHMRTIRKKGNNVIELQDDINGSAQKAVAHFHFSEYLKIYSAPNEISFEGGRMTFENAEAIQLKTYQLAKGYNRLVEAMKVEVLFYNTLKTSIRLYEV